MEPACAAASIAVLPRGGYPANSPAEIVFGKDFEGDVNLHLPVTLSAIPEVVDFIRLCFGEISPLTLPWFTE